jgi:hypothetical protein
MNLHSIQKYGRKINSIITIYDIVSLGIVCSVLGGIVTYINYLNKESYTPVSYVAYSNSNELNRSLLIGGAEDTSRDSQPFASKKGKTYTFSWCSGASRISAKNKIYFKSEADAKSSGRTLSKLCK